MLLEARFSYVSALKVLRIRPFRDCGSSYAGCFAVASRTAFIEDCSCNMRSLVGRFKCLVFIFELASIVCDTLLLSTRPSLFHKASISNYFKHFLHCLHLYCFIRAQHCRSQTTSCHVELRTIYLRN